MLKSQLNEENFTQVSYQKLNPTYYQLEINNSSGQKFLDFNETYDPNWEAESNGQVLKSKFSDPLSNIFEIPEGNLKIIVKYKAEDYEIFDIRLAGIEIFLGMFLMLIQNRKRVILWIQNL
jgi:hypothetical protein